MVVAFDNYCDEREGYDTLMTVNLKNNNKIIYPSLQFQIGFTLNLNK